MPSPAGREAGSGVVAPPYVRHRPERTLLYQLVEEYFPAFKAYLAAQGSFLPKHVGKEFEEFLKCGRLEHGFPRQPVRQWVLSVPYPLRFLFASRPEIMSHVLGIVYRCIATHLCKKAGFSRKVAQTGAVTLIQRFGWSGTPSALNLNVHFHMLFLGGRPGMGCTSNVQSAH